MQPRLSPVRLTVIDFMGVFLPGSIWMILLVTLGAILGWSNIPNPNPVTVAIFLCEEEKATGVISLVMAGVSALILGYLAKALSLGFAESLSTIAGSVSRQVGRLVRRKHVDIKYSSADYRFPYEAIHREKAYYGELEKAVERKLGIGVADLPGNKLFSACKSMLHLYGGTSTLAEMIQHREAEVRMLSSLSTASVFSVSLAAFSFTPWVNTPSHSMAWLLISLLATLILVKAFRVRREFEVLSVYLYTFVSLPIMSDESKEQGREFSEDHQQKSSGEEAICAA